jgi:hypothetical protein
VQIRWRRSQIAETSARIRVLSALDGTIN